MVVRNHEGKYLAINETRDRGWWLVGGHLDYGELYEDCVKRECVEEAEIEIEIKGFLRVEVSPFLKDSFSHTTLIYYAEPVEATCHEKTVPDEHSLGSRWMSVEEMRKETKWRANDLIHWAEYIEAGGYIMPKNFAALCFEHLQDPVKDIPFRIK